VEIYELAPDIYDRNAYLNDPEAITGRDEGQTIPAPAPQGGAGVGVAWPLPS
jgi:hypothetical protein